MKIKNKSILVQGLPGLRFFLTSGLFSHLFIFLCVFSFASLFLSTPVSASLCDVGGDCVSDPDGPVCRQGCWEASGRCGELTSSTNGYCCSDDSINDWQADGIVALGSSWDCDEDEVAYDGSQYRTDCTYVGSSSEYSCDSDIDLGGNGFIQDGICSYTGGTDEDAYNCDTAEVCIDAGKYQDDCDRCGAGKECDRNVAPGYTRDGRCGGDDCCTVEYVESDECYCDYDDTTQGNDRQCDTTPAIGTGYNGICVSNEARDDGYCDTGEVCYDGSRYYGDCSYSQCSNGDACDTNVDVSGFFADGVCSGNDCVLVSGCPKFGAAAGDQACNDTCTYLDEELFTNGDLEIQNGCILTLKGTTNLTWKATNKYIYVESGGEMRIEDTAGINKKS